MQGNHEHVHIYLRASPDYLMNRIKRRGQTGDLNISQLYLELLHQKHEEYISKIQNVIIINIEDYSKLDDIVTEIFRKLTPFIVKNIERK